MRKLQLLQQMKDAGVVAVLRGSSAAEVTAMAEKAIEGGVKVIEITMTTPFACEAITALAQKYQSRDTSGDHYAIIGAGTVLDAETARAVLLAGAEFVVSPSFNEATVRLCNRYCVPVLPGAMTVREIAEALELGVDVIKLFPGNLYSPSIISTLQGPLPQVNLMPTGGVNLDNLKDWIAAGAFGVGIGSDLTKEAVASGNFDRITEKARAYIQAYRDAKAAK